MLRRDHKLSRSDVLERLLSSCEQLRLIVACRLVWNSHLRGRPDWSELTDVIKFFILQRAAAAKNTQFNLMYVLTVRSSCGGGKKAESRRRVAVNILVLLLLAG